MISTVPQGEIVGVSWLVPPYRWVHDARAVELTRVDRLERQVPAAASAKPTIISATR